MISFREESVAQVEPEGRGLTLSYLTENGNPLETKFNWQAYYTMEALGVLTTVAARDADGVLVGVGFVTISANFTDYAVAQLSLFLHKTFRKGLVGLRFAQFLYQIAKDKGVAVSFVTLPFKSNDALFKRMGFKPAQVIYTKEL